jgi:hypothetical protein
VAPATPRVPAPGHRLPLLSCPGKMRTSWPNCNGRFIEQARLSRGRLPLPFGGHPGQSVGQDHRARRPLVFDGHKRVKGRKRLLVDTLGMVARRSEHWRLRPDGRPNREPDDTAWKIAEQLYLSLSDTRPYFGDALPDKPPSVPWLAVILNRDSPALEWLEDFERCYAWFLLENSAPGS